MRLDRDQHQREQGEGDRPVEADRQTGILHNELYVGRIVWNKQNYRKNPETERRTARLNDKSDWVVTEVPSMRIVSDELWACVKNGN
ncbi:recombinase family protein [Shinella sumterensis]|uniref:recombinase family protein n=1 Tax=Shinella sumterensis TaxID=1967501 RepID=UPI002E762B78|nr:recombinase family protein [Shinella sumterensis]